MSKSNKQQRELDIESRDAEIDVLLIEADAQMVAEGKPIISVLVRKDDTGKVGPAFWHAVKSYGLRLPDEQDGPMIERLTYEASAYHKGIRH